MRILTDSLYATMKFSPKQAAILRDRTRIICIDGGRRFGKSFIGAAKSHARFRGRLSVVAWEIAEGKRKPWPGLGYKKHVARHISPDVIMYVVAPRAHHLIQCKNYIVGYYAGHLNHYLHPELGVCDGGRTMYLIVGGACGVIKYVVGHSATSVISSHADVIWIDEAGYLENEVKEAIDPILWQAVADQVYTGTPAEGYEHWFTQACLRGLDPDHPLAEPDKFERHPDYRTYIGTSYEAYLPEVRSQARADAEKNGADWEKLYVLGNWRVESQYVYASYREDVHVIDYDHQAHRINGCSCGRPDVVALVKDWSYGANPGAACVYHVWIANPLDRERNLPLIVVVDDREDVGTYTQESWWRYISDLETLYHPDKYWADPSMEELIQQARRVGIPFRSADKSNKLGRIATIRALLHHSPSVRPSLYISRRARHTIREISDYRYRKNRTTGESSGKPMEHNDHCLDCLAYLVGMVAHGGYAVLDVPG